MANAPSILASWTAALQYTLAQLRAARGAYAPTGTVPKMTNQDASALILLLRKVETYRHDQGDIRTSALAPSDWYTWAKPALGWFRRGDKFDMSKTWREHEYQPTFASALVTHLIQLAATLDAARIPTKVLADPRGTPATYQQLALDSYKRMQREDPESADVKPHKPPVGQKNRPTPKPDAIIVQPSPPAPPAPQPPPPPVVVPTPAGPALVQHPMPPAPPPQPPPPPPVVIPVTQPSTPSWSPTQPGVPTGADITPLAATVDDGGVQPDEPSPNARAAARDDAAPRQARPPVVADRDDVPPMPSVAPSDIAEHWRREHGDQTHESSPAPRDVADNMRERFRDKSDDNSGGVGRLIVGALIAYGIAELLD